MNAFDSRFKTKSTNAKQKRKANLPRRAHHAVALRSRDNYRDNFLSACRREGESGNVYLECYRGPLRERGVDEARVANQSTEWGLTSSPARAAGWCRW